MLSTLSCIRGGFYFYISANLTSSELKKLRNKQRRAERRAEASKEEEKKREHQNHQRNKEKNEDPENRPPEVEQLSAQKLARVITRAYSTISRSNHRQINTNSPVKYCAMLF